MTNYQDDLNDQFMQFIMDQLNKSYSQFEKDHPDFARVVETQCEGKTQEEFERGFTKKPGRCQSCGEGLDWFEDICSSCGRINK